MWWVIAGVLAVGAGLSGPVMSNVEQPQYRVVEARGAIEVRDYPAMVVAQAEVAGERDAAINAGFRTVADYIFGNNTAAQKLAMTAPVTGQPAGEKIAMTAPVTQQPAGSAWVVRFIMPAQYTLATLPLPRNPAVTLKTLAPQRLAVIRFSGRATAAALQRETATLQAFIDERHWRAQAAPTYAFYNPPWTLPFLRRNEVMMPIAVRTAALINEEQP